VAPLTSTATLDLSLADAGSRPAAAAPPRPAPEAPEDAVRLALRLRECRAAAGGRVLMFVPATAGERVERLVSGITQALDQLQEGAVHVIDLAGRAVPFLSSAEFAATIAMARSRYAYVLCMAGAVTDSVEGLVAAAQCDGVVLSVSAHRTTLREVQAAERQLARVRANVLGFVVQHEGRRQ
jgi:hypothetical protein